MGPFRTGAAEKLVLVPSFTTREANHSSQCFVLYWYWPMLVFYFKKKNFSIFLIKTLWEINVFSKSYILPPCMTCLRKHLDAVRIVSLHDVSFRVRGSVQDSKPMSFYRQYLLNTVVLLGFLYFSTWKKGKKGRREGKREGGKKLFLY